MTDSGNEEDNSDEESKFHAKKLQRKFILTTGYICMFLLFVYFWFASAHGRFYLENSFSKVAVQLNQLSADAEKASGS